MHWALEQSSGPAVEPLTTAQAKDHLRIDSHDEDTLIDNYVKSARYAVEQLTGRQLITATYKLYMEEYPTIILLPRPPLSSVTSITYVDTSGTTQTESTDNYSVDSKSAPGRIVEAYGKNWSTPRKQANSVTVTYVAGYGAAATSIPEPLIQAVRLLVGHYYENREHVSLAGVPRVLPMAVEALCKPYDVRCYASLYPGYDE